MSLLGNVKVMLGIEDESLDSKLKLIIENSQKRLLAYLPSGLEEAPEELEWIVQDLSIIRFNRIGNEGMSAYGQEGESISYDKDDITPYMSAIDAWNKSQEENTKGVVRFL